MPAACYNLNKIMSQKFLYMHNDIEGKLVYTRCKAKLVLETLEYNQYTQP